jgi:hypothetical protein
VEIPPKDWETNKDLRLIERIANEIIEDIK